MIADQTPPDELSLVIFTHLMCFRRQGQAITLQDIVPDLIYSALRPDVGIDGYDE